jgi:hypothetical protein
LHEEVAVVPPDEVVRLLETEMDNTPAPDDEDADEFDPALAVAWDPVPGALDDSAEQGVIGAASAVGNSDAAATASTATELTRSGRTALLSRGNTEVLLSRGTRHLMPPEATPRPKMLGTERAHFANIPGLALLVDCAEPEKRKSCGVNGGASLAISSW